MSSKKILYLFEFYTNSFYLKKSTFITTPMTALSANFRT